MRTATRHPFQMLLEGLALRVWRVQAHGELHSCESDTDTTHVLHRTCCTKRLSSDRRCIPTPTRSMFYTACYWFLHPQERKSARSVIDNIIKGSWHDLHKHLHPSHRAHRPNITLNGASAAPMINNGIALFCSLNDSCLPCIIHHVVHNSARELSAESGTYSRTAAEPPFPASSAPLVPALPPRPPRWLGSNVDVRAPAPPAAAAPGRTPRLLKLRTALASELVRGTGPV